MECTLSNKLNCLRKATDVARTWWMSTRFKRKHPLIAALLMKAGSKWSHVTSRRVFLDTQPNYSALLLVVSSSAHTFCSIRQNVPRKRSRSSAPGHAASLQLGR